MRTATKYFTERHIALAVYVGSKWDPRTLEGKFVSKEPFVFKEGVGQAEDSIARPVRNASTARIGQRVPT